MTMCITHRIPALCSHNALAANEAAGFSAEVSVCGGFSAAQFNRTATAEGNYREAAV
jgi:hypothetical protein